MATYKLAVIIKNPSNHEEFLLVKQTRPPKFGEEEYDSYVDSDLFDLPSAQLSLSQAQSPIHVADASSDHNLDLGNFDLASALTQVSEQVKIGRLDEIQWKFWKYVEEPEFGPGPPVHTVYISSEFAVSDGIDEGACQWISWSACIKWLYNVKQDRTRIGPLVVNGFLHGYENSKWDFMQKLHCQAYSPDFMLIPMESRTRKPFRTTNLIVIAPEIGSNSHSNDGCVVHGDALIVDPGCNSQCHQELSEIVAALPRKLLVFVTHHHPDHVDGLSVVQKCNPEAVLLAHENTMQRIGKGDWSLGYTAVTGGEKINVKGQELEVVFAPGHTDGHMGLFHINTHALIVGDHCVGQGSAVLDMYSGGNMADYFQTTYKFLELSPHGLIPMHGRVNMWPKHMLCKYLKNRRERESSVLKAIEDGGTTLFDLVSTIYKGVDRGLWIPAASNVKLHVDHLAHLKRLPKAFSLPNFQRSCTLHFGINWICAYINSRMSSKIALSLKLVVPMAVACFAVIYYARNLPAAER